MFSWHPGFNDAGTYADIRFFVSDGEAQSSGSVTILIRPALPPLVLMKPADMTLRENDSVRFTLQTQGEEDNELFFFSDLLPFGATLHPEPRAPALN